MPNSDFVRCFIYEQLEPFGEKGDYLRAGVLTSLIAEIHRDPKRRQEPFRPDEWFPAVDYEQRKAISEAQQIQKMIEAFARSNPGTIRIRPKPQHGRNI